MALSSFVFEQLAMSLSLKDRALLSKFFYKNGVYGLTVLKKFWSLKAVKKGCGSKSAKNLKKK